MLNQPITNSQRGVSLIEVLVSVLLLSIALIGIAGLQAATTRYQLGSESRASLSKLVNDISTRMLANSGRMGDYVYSANWSTQAATPTAPGKLCGTESGAVACNESERSTYDIWQWRVAARGALPQGSVFLSIPDATNPLVRDAFLIWFDKDFTGDTVTSTNTTGLRTSATCTVALDTLAASDAGAATLRRQTCCPDGASVSTTPGVRCARFTVLP